MTAPALAPASPAAPAARRAPPFLAARPPPVVARAVAHVLLLGFVVLLAAAAAVDLPIVVRGRFVLSPVHGTDPVQAPRAGIVASVSASEGDLVASGIELFVLRSDDAGERAGDIESLELSRAGLEARRRNEQRRLGAEIEAAEEARRARMAKIEHVRRELDLAKERVALERAQEKRAVQLRADGLADDGTVARVALSVNEAERELSRLSGDKDELAAEAAALAQTIEAKRSEQAEVERSLQEELEHANVKLAARRASPALSGSSELRVASPCEGTVTRLHVRSPGSVVEAGSVLAEVACAKDDLEADVTVSDADLGLVRRGAHVRLFYDAFPYQRHGVQHGRVRFFGSSGAVDKDAPRFRVLAELMQRSFVIGGESYPLMAGMGGRAEIVVGKHSMLAAALEPIRALREDLREEAAPAGSVAPEEPASPP